MDRLAVGGMAEIFRAKAPTPVGEARIVVVKRMLPHIAARTGADALFRREADIGRVVHHRNVVEVLAVGEQDGQPYLVLEYVRGEDLWGFTRWLTRTGTKLPVEVALYIVHELLTGLEIVHGAVDGDGQPLNLVHRDVSPSNVLVSVHGDVKLGDFGIAHAQQRDQLRPAGLGARAKGKLGYLAPEQVTGQSYDQRADVFSAGVIAAELLMGRPLFAGGSELAVLLAIRDAQILPLRELSPRMPAGLVDVIAEALRKSPEARTPTAAAFKAALLPFLEGRAKQAVADLSTLVSKAHGDNTETPDESTPLLELTPSIHDVATPMWEAPGSPQADGYRVRTAAGENLGPFPYAEMVKALSTGKLGPDDLVDSGHGMMPLGQVPDLRRHLPPSTSFTDPSAEHRTIASVDELVPLSEGGFVTALAYAVMRRDTGLLLCELSGVRKEVYLEEGTPAFVTSNLAGELLGEYLLSQGVITRAELDMALAVMPRFEGKLGDTLTGLGLIEPVHLFQHIANQVRNKLLDLFLWEGGTASFYAGVAPPQSGFPLSLDPWAILDQGIQRRMSRGMERERFRGRASALLMQHRHLPDGGHGALPDFIEGIYRALETPQTLAQLRKAHSPTTHRDLTAVDRALILLLQVGAVRFEGEA